MLHEQHINLLDPPQLAEVQLARNAPNHIWVLAPDPLELHDDDFYKSTLDWVGRHADRVSKDRTPPNTDPESASLVFWYRRSQRSSIPALKVFRRLKNDLPSAYNLELLFALVEYPDDLLVLDQTVHFFADGSNKVHFNAKDRGITTLLHQMTPWHAIDFLDRAWRWLSTAAADDADLYPAIGPSHAEKIRRLSIPDNVFLKLRGLSADVTVESVT